MTDTTHLPQQQQTAVPGARLGAVLAVLGAGLLAAGTWLHPMHADAGVPAAAFAEYAAAGHVPWVAGHLLQFGGIAGMVLAVVLLSRTITGARESAWARVTTVAGAAGLATAATLQAVDGVALKAMVDLWSGATEDRAALFSAALAVRQIEIGLDGLLALLLAVVFLGFGLALLSAPTGTRSLAVLALATAGAAAVNGVALCLGGFSDVAMLATTASGLLGIATLLVAARWSWRRGTPRAGRPPTPVPGIPGTT
jgi:hypothetical protein